MAAPIWTVRPAYTPAQITARFGAGARLVHMGNGKWTVAGAAAPVASSAPVPPAPAAAPLPTSLGQQAGIDAISGQLAALPGIYNPQRLALYASGARGLTDQGYFDTATADVSATDPTTGAVSYKVVQGPDGQLYRQAVNDTAAAANSRGMLFSSATREAQARGASALNNAREAILRGLSSSQDEITRQQTGQYVSLLGDQKTAQGDYADWQASQPVPPPPAPGAAAAAPAGPAGPNNPRGPAGKLASRVWWGTDRYRNAARRAG